jgi:hypothetical protein
MVLDSTLTHNPVTTSRAVRDKPKMPKISRSSRATRSTLNTSSRKTCSQQLIPHMCTSTSITRARTTQHTPPPCQSDLQILKYHYAYMFTSESSRPVIFAQESRSAYCTHRLRPLSFRPLARTPSCRPGQSGTVVQAQSRRSCCARPVVQARQPRDVAQGCALQRPAVAVVPVKVLLCVPRGLSRGFRSGAVQTLCDGCLCYRHICATNMDWGSLTAERGRSRLCISRSDTAWRGGKHPMC